MRIKLTLLLDHEKDSDILNYLDGMSSVMRNRLLKDLLRGHIHGDYNKETVKDQLADIKDMLKDWYRNIPTGTPFPITVPDVQDEAWSDDDEKTALENLMRIG